VVVQRLAWISGDEPQKGWLLVGGPDRCRLLSGAEVNNDPSYRSLQASIEVELAMHNVNSLEFRDEAMAALPLRLLPVEVNPRGPGWRLTLPKLIAAIMQIRPKESEVALLYVQEHIEIWTIEALRSSVTAPLGEIV
jgi:hypothetical protein